MLLQGPYRRIKYARNRRRPPRPDNHPSPLRKREDFATLLSLGTFTLLLLYGVYTQSKPAEQQRVRARILGLLSPVFPLDVS